MTYIRRLILALALSAGLAPAFAQVPPPVPALPDTERRTSYSISASTCACSVGFALYGDSTDYANWIEVFVNGVQMAQAGNWTLSSATGTIGSIPLPITNAVLTFTAPQTGTIQIVGARRPRRTSQFNESTGVPTRNFNVVLSDLTAQNREVWDKINDVTGRSVRTPPGETLALLPKLSSRQNMGACFDSGGNLTSCVSVPSSSFVAGNGITLSGVSPTTIAANLVAGTGITITGTNPLTIASSGFTIAGTAGNIAVSGSCTTTGTCTIDLATSRKTNPAGCAINATATATCADGSAGANNGTYTTPTGALWLEVELIGGGGGGCGSGTTPGAGGAGTATTFGTGPLISSGAATACVTTNGGTGAVPSGGFMNKTGGSGGNGSGSTTANPGGTGCVSPFGGGGAAGVAGAGVGGAAAANSGSGGGGGGVNATAGGGGGGACGGFVRAIIQSPNATYTYAIGAGGAGGTTGTSGAAGGAGGSGYIQIIPHFN